ncbi:hypothetical protein [Novosphingobium sp. TH158]|uniref:hypothetical protein n=1 Tax=Novosphingobium sp. TH158 TaxID=2067455 RepID=UPI001C1F851D|nr:hypothetical protein [Novosphingobium sp. TH158]
MTKKMLILLSSMTLPLAACNSMSDDRTLATVGTGAALGAAAGTGVAAIAGGDLLTGAVIGAAAGGIAGAVWADRDGDGRVDGYTRDGQYYSGTPSSNVAYSTPRRCPSVAGSAATGAAVGAATGLGVGAVTDASLFEGAVVGAVVGGLAGAIWADSNNDGCVDGYMRDGRYYQGAPVVQPTYYRSGERG